jgi:hydroxyethylthiazole kinase-like uncharacterized protein yjeF
MTQAALAAAGHAIRMLGARRSVWVVAGRGNNGGDAVVVAERLRQSEIDVTLIRPDAKEPREPVAAEALAAYRAHGGVLRTTWPQAPAPGLIIDGLLGIGLRAAPDSAGAAIIGRINSSGSRVLSLDLPSGLDADTGARRGACVAAHTTVTFIAGKPGLFTGQGPAVAGRVIIEDLGLTLPDDGIALLEARDVREMAPRRAITAHKGMQGTLQIVAGATGMAGAGLLAGRAAVALGAGKVLMLGSDGPVDGYCPEMMFPEAPPRSLPEAIVIGPGLGDSAAAHLRMRMPMPVPMLLDADALNAIADDSSLADAVRARQAPTLLTPHPSEAARLLACQTAAVESDRIEAAREMAQRFRSLVILKGPGSIIASPQGKVAINPTGNAGLATAGSGDALAGILGALLARGCLAWQAACLGTWLHGAAAERIARARGIEGVRARALAEAAAVVLEELTGAECADRHNADAAPRAGRL